MSQPEIKAYEDRHKTEVLTLMRKLREHLITLNPDRVTEIPEEYYQKYFEKVENQIASGKRKMFVSEQNNQVIGYVCGVIISPDELNSLQFKPEKVGEVIDLYVEVSFREQGLGQQLLDTISKYFKEKRCTKISLSVLKKNQNAFNFYQKYGFYEKTVQMILELQ